MSGETFIDTAALLALINRDDSLHQRASGVLRSLAATAGLIVTTEWVLSEFLSAAARRPLRTAAIRAVERLLASQRTTIVRSSHELWMRGVALFRERSDKSWSHVNCTSILTCQDRRIQSVFTSDRHFTQAGLSILMPAE